MSRVNSNLDELHRSEKYSQWRSDLNVNVQQAASRYLQGGRAAVLADGSGFAVTFEPIGTPAEKERGMQNCIRELGALPGVRVSLLPHALWKVHVDVVEEPRRGGGCYLLLWLLFLVGVLCLGFYIYRTQYPDLPLRLF